VRVAFTGAHGVGKTTASRVLWEAIRDEKKNGLVVVLGSVTRNVLDWGGNSRSSGPKLTPESNSFQLACIYERRHKMLDVSSLRADYLISERWAMDETAYQMYKVRENRTNEATDTLRVCQMEMRWELENYWDTVYYIPLSGREIENDGTRPTDVRYQTEIDELIRYSLKSTSLSSKVKTIPTELEEMREFFDKEVKKWKK